MKAGRRIISRLRGSWSRRPSDSDLAAELELHIELQTADNIRAGMAPDEARRAARMKFGGIEAVKESYRDQRGLPFIESLIADVRYAVRQLCGTPGFTITAVVAIALGIGANTAIFSVMNTVLLKPLPIPEPDRLVVLTRTTMSNEGEEGETSSASPVEFAHWRTQSSVLEDVSASLWTGMNYTGGTAVELWHARRASAGIFRAFRLPVLQGRTFTPEEELPNGPHVAVISEGLMKRRFGNDPQIVGQSVSLNGELYTVVGVVADGPGVLEMGATLTDVYVPFQLDPNTTDPAHNFIVVARLKPGVTLEQAKQQLRISADAFRARFPKYLAPKESFSALRYHDAIFFDEPNDQSEMYVLIGAVNMVLLIACANVANLLLVRGANRRREIGIRIAIGAGRRRVMRQLLTECLLLSVVGGATGLLIGDVGIRALVYGSFADVPPFWKFGIDWSVVGFTSVVSVLTALIFGLLPAFQSSRVDLNSVLKDSGGRSGTGFRQNKTRALLVVSEVSLAVILLIGSALLIRTFVALYKVDRGFESTNVLLMHTSMIGPKYAKTANVAETIRNGLNRIRALPGVSVAGTAGYAPLTGSLSLNFDIAGRASGERPESVGWVPVSAGYFDVFKIPLKRGRAFTERDDARSAPVVVINESMAKRFWKDGDPLNDRITIGVGAGPRYEDMQLRQIVGIVGDVRQQSLISGPEPRMYVPQAQLPDAVNEALMNLAPNAWAVRAQRETHEISMAIQEQIRQATGLPVFEVHSMNQMVAGSVENQRFMMLVITIFASLALLLAAIGIYGVMAYTVEQRAHEIGIRIALGAEASAVRNMVVRHGMGLTLAGVTLGLAAASGFAGVTRGMLFGVEPRDPLVFVTVPAVLGAVALLAVWLPATRASRVNPMESLRCE